MSKYLSANLNCYWNHWTQVQSPPEHRRSWTATREWSINVSSFSPISCISANCLSKSVIRWRTGGKFGGSVASLVRPVAADACCIACVNISVVITPEFVLLAEVVEGELERGKLLALALETAAASCAVVIIVSDWLVDRFGHGIESEGCEKDKSPAISSSSLILSKL